MKFVCLLLAAASLVSAHFTLDYPPTTGFDEDQEVNAPCGGFPPDASNLTAWPLSGGEISVDLHHPYALFLFRAQLMGSDTWFNLSNGMVYMSGLGEGCIHALPVPSSWSGQAGVVQVVGQPPDAILYQVPPLVVNQADRSALVSYLPLVPREPRMFARTGRASPSTIQPNSSPFQISASILSGPRAHRVQAQAPWALQRVAQGLFVLNTELQFSGLHFRWED
jgi:hypothetical protein